MTKNNKNILYSLILTIGLIGCTKSAPVNPEDIGKNLAKHPESKVNASSVATAAEVSKTRDILAILMKKAPQLAALKPDINWNPTVNMYELHAGLQVVYISKDGANLFQGHIMGIDSGTDYTDMSIAKLSKINTNSLPMKYSIKVVSGDGTNPLYIFSPLDDNLKLYYQNTLSQLNNVTMYFFLSPSPEMVNDDAYAKAYKTRVFNWVYCSENQSRELSNFLQNKEKNYTPQTSQLDNCESQTTELDSKHLFGNYKIVYSPTLFTSDGNRYQPQNLVTLQGLLKVSQVEKGESVTSTESSNKVKTK